jgi:hypothetical protein
LETQHLVFVFSSADRFKIALSVPNTKAPVCLSNVHNFQAPEHLRALAVLTLTFWSQDYFSARNGKLAARCIGETLRVVGNQGSALTRWRTKRCGHYRAKKNHGASVCDFWAVLGPQPAFKRRKTFYITLFELLKLDSVAGINRLSLPGSVAAGEANLA